MNKSAARHMVAGVGLSVLCVGANAEMITPDVIFGDGNFNEEWTVATDGTIEVGLRAKERFERTYNRVGSVYTMQAGESDGAALWNFEFSVNLNKKLMHCVFAMLG